MLPSAWNPNRTKRSGEFRDCYVDRKPFSMILSSLVQFVQRIYIFKFSVCLVLSYLCYNLQTCLSWKNKCPCYVSKNVPDVKVPEGVFVCCWRRGRAFTLFLGFLQRIRYQASWSTTTLCVAQGSTFPIRIVGWQPLFLF